MAFNPTQAEDMAGIDTIESSTRVRASKSPVTFTDASGTVTIAANPLGTNYIDGAGTPFSTSLGGSSATTLAASKFLTGVIVLTATSGTVTTDTAANFFTACNAVCPSGVQNGDYITTLIMNDSVSSVILAGGTGVTSANASTSSIAANQSRYCLFRFNTPTSINMYF